MITTAVGATADALRSAAAWFDEEYRRESGAQEQRLTDAHHVGTGRLQALADAAASLRSWAATGKEPQHRAEKRPHMEGSRL